MAKLATDALDFLKDEHAEVDALFEQFENAADDEKVSIATRICTALTVHATMEERSFYPTAREALEGNEDARDLLDEAAVEHRSLKSLIAEIEGLGVEDDLFEASVEVLGEYVRHHVNEEEKELFPLLEESELALEALGADLQALKKELAAEAEEQVSGGGDAVLVPSFEPKSRAKKAGGRRTKKKTGAAAGAAASRSPSHR